MYNIFMKKNNIFLLLWIIWLLWISSTNAYIFWFKSADNTIANIQSIEQKYDIDIPLVWFIFDPRGNHIIDTLNQLSWTLGNNRIYHITLSPNLFSAQEVANGAFDQQYQLFFKTVKNNDLKVIFRTMHEMNGWRYPRSSNPNTFKKAWIHIRDLSRELGLSTKNILFDFSVNHRDMPTKEIPNQKAKLIPCQLTWKERLWCYTFEDYYPWDKYVDIVWFTFYNRWKGNSDRRWLTPKQIVYEKWREPLTRLRKLEKPIIIDEVGTTAVWYDSWFDYSLSRDIYKTNYKMKNIRLRQLQQLLIKETDIFWAIYFNVDYTNWLSEKIIGEADWAAINTNTNKVYNTIFSLFKGADDLHLWNPLVNLFWVWVVDIQWKNTFLSIEHITKIKTLELIINKIGKTKEDREKIRNLLGTSLLKKIFPDTSVSDREILIRNITQLDL